MPIRENQGSVKVSKTNTYSYIKFFRWIYSRLQKNRKKQFWILFIVMAIAALLETLSLGSIAVFASTITDPEIVLTSKYVKFINQIVAPDFSDTSRKIILIFGFFVIALVTIKNCVKSIVIYSIARFGVSVETYFGKILIEGFLTLPYRWHLTCNSADLVNAISWRTFLGSGFFQPCLNIFNNALLVILMLMALLIVQPIVSLVVFLVLGGTALFIYMIIKRQIDKFNTIAKNYHLSINRESTMAIHGIKDVKITQKENAFVLKFCKNADPLSRIIGLQRFFSGAPVMILETIGFVMLCLSICIMIIWTDASSAYTTGTMTLLAVTAWKALPAVNQILGSLTIARNSLPYISNQIQYFALIEAERKKTIENQIRPLKFSNSIKFTNVGFSYDEELSKIFHGLSFEIIKGETVGIIGSSGAGKSTLVNLLIGLLKPNEGSIQIDGQALTDELLPKWLGITGYVPQSPYIYDGSLSENVAFGIDNVDIKRDRVHDCCAMASMNDFLYDLPDGIDSFVGERGLKLSGGQQQRLAIARALYKNPEVMIFDEATSSLDTKSEKSIQRTIYSFKGKQTLVIIAHRLSTVKDCDKVIWLEKGKIKMVGKPEDVLNEYKQPERKCLTTNQF